VGAGRVEEDADTRTSSGMEGKMEVRGELGDGAVEVAAGGEEEDGGDGAVGGVEADRRTVRTLPVSSSTVMILSRKWAKRCPPTVQQCQ
jgi:hypothetical protein